MSKSISSSNFVIPLNIVSFTSLITFYFLGDIRFYIVSGVCLLAVLLIAVIAMIFVAFNFGIKFVMELDINIFEILLFLLGLGSFILTSLLLL